LYEKLTFAYALIEPLAVVVKDMNTLDKDDIWTKVGPLIDRSEI
jgi:hypothetical protein